MNGFLLICSTYVFFCIASGGTSEIDYYELLGVGKSASDLEIRQAFKKLAILYHPDKNKDAPREHFVKITEAYDVLKNPIKRREYNYMKQSHTHRFKSYGMSTAEYNNLFYNGLYSQDEDVESLSGDNFYKFRDYGMVFVNFYSPFCPPCQHLADTWKELGRRLKGVVRIGAVNCKLYSNFCLQNIGVRSYPNLIFYSEDNNRYFVYNGHHTLEALEKFALSFIESHIHIQVTDRKINSHQLIVYIMGDNLLEYNTVLKIAYKLRNTAKVFKVTNEKLRIEMTDEDDTVTVVFTYNGSTHKIMEFSYEQILEEITSKYSKVKDIGPEDVIRIYDDLPTVAGAQSPMWDQDVSMLLNMSLMGVAATSHRHVVACSDAVFKKCAKEIRNTLRSNTPGKPWCINFQTATKDTDMTVNQLAMINADYNYGKIDCDKYYSLCRSFQVEAPPGWGLLKRGGAYEVAFGANTFEEIAHFLKSSVDLEHYQTLSFAEYARIMDGEDGVWVVIVAPLNTYWEEFESNLKKASRYFKDEKIEFGATICRDVNQCRYFNGKKPVLLVHNHTRTFQYSNALEVASIVQFIKNIMDSRVIYLDEDSYYKHLNPKSKETVWYVFFMPTNCGLSCETHSAELRDVAFKLKDFDFIHISVIDCNQNKDFCKRLNINKPTVRLYPRNNGYGYVGNIEELNKSPYITSWILDRMDDSVRALTQISFEEHITERRDGKAWLVYFHSPRCSFCYEHYPDFVRAGLKLGKVSLGRVNCLAERNLCYNQGINRYPSIKLFKDKFNSKRSISIESLKFEELFDDIDDYFPKHDEL